MASGLLAALRECTRAQHAQLDAAFAGADAFSRARYVALLRASLAVHESLEPALARWLPALAEVRRVERLRADLAALGEPAPVAPAPIHAPTDRAAALGAAYVVEGSALGGLVLAERFAAALALPPDTATSYLRLRGRATMDHWRGFAADLAAEPPTDAATAQARATFADYHAAFVVHGVIAA